MIAEGVEDDVTLLALRDMQCYAAQGFGPGRPFAPAVLPALVLDPRLRRAVPGFRRNRGACARFSLGTGRQSFGSV